MATIISRREKAGSGVVTRSRVLIISTLLFIVLLIASTSRRIGEPTSSDVKSTQAVAPLQQDDDGTAYESGIVLNQNVMWHKPSNGPIRGMLVVCHGCHHAHTDFFPPTTACSTCLGLPEELAIVRVAREHGLIVVAISSQNRRSGCWNFEDGPIVASVLREIRHRWGNTDLPIYAFGASSGGAFVGGPLILALEKNLSGYIAQIASPEAVYNSGQSVVYLTMNRDPLRDKEAKKYVPSLQARGVPAKHIRLDPLPIHDGYFSNRISNIAPELSAKLTSALRTADLIDTDGYLRSDPRHSRWREVLEPHADINVDNLAADESAISEVLNVAYGMHEMTRDGVQEAIQFLMLNNVKS